MHEHGLADRILETALRQGARPTHAVPTRIAVFVSELAGLSPDVLQMNLDHVCAHEGLPEIVLDVTVVDLIGSCSSCGEVSVLSTDLICPACGADRVTLCAGETVLVSACEYAPTTCGHTGRPAERRTVEPCASGRSSC